MNVTFSYVRSYIQYYITNLTSKSIERWSTHVLTLIYILLLSRFNLAVEFTLEELAHWILPREGVVSSFVITNDAGDVTDVGSYYHLPSSVMRNPLHNKLNAAYSFYNVATSVSFKDLMNDMLILARDVSAHSTLVK